MEVHLPDGRGSDEPADDDLIDDTSLVQITSMRHGLPATEVLSAGLPGQRS